MERKNMNIMTSRSLMVLVIVSGSALLMVNGQDTTFDVNVALGKPARQSSTYRGQARWGDRDNFYYDASLAVDGKEDTNFRWDSCSHTDAGHRNAWWEVDLESLYSITRIKIYQRSDDFTDRNVGSTISGKLENDSYEVLTTLDNRTVFTFNADASSIFKGIRVDHSGGKDVFICLCEVEVFVVNVARSKPTSQSSTYIGVNYGDHGLYNASLAVDGNIDQDFHQNSCSHTNSGQSEWWQVDLQDLYAVTGIRIYQRLNGNDNWLSGYKLLGRSNNGTYEIINTPPYNTGLILISVLPVKAFDEIMIQLNSTEHGICLCEVQIIATIACSKPALNPTMGKYACTERVAGACAYMSMLTIQCNTGYKLSGYNSSQCIGTNHWSRNIGVCVAITCSRPSLDPTMGTYACTERVAGACAYKSMLTIQCNMGYKLSGYNSSQCIGTDNWSRNIGVCVAITCSMSQLNQTNGTYECTERATGGCAYNSTLTIRCNTGYKLLGYNSSQCIDKDHWNRSIGVCDAITCSIPPLNLTIGKYECILRVAGACDYNSILTIQCNTGYKLSGYDSSQCIGTDLWNRSIGVCEVINCDQSIQNVKHVSLTVLEGIKGNISYNTSVSLTCEDGYYLQGTGLVRCNGSGQWEGDLGTCSAKLRNEEPESNVAGVAGGVAAAICLVILGVIIGFILYKRRTRGPDDTIVDTTLSEIPSSSQRREHKKEDIIEKSIHAQPKQMNYPKQNPECEESKNVYMNSNDSSKEYYSFTLQKLPDKHSIRVEDLASLFVSRKMEPNLYEEEYNNLPDGLTKPHETALLPENRSKNRYKNIYPYDDTRVILEIWDPSNESDYINACYVNGFKTFHTYIAAQGPTKGILNDFWRMIWQTNCSTIVMLTNLTEEGKHKCEQYWPDEGSVEYGDIVIRLIQCETFSDFTIRTLLIGKKNGKSKGGKTGTHQISQFHFTAWPDRGVPRFASSLVHFRQKIRAANTRQKAEGPMIVHCSAGIGRTGTFLALDYLLDQAEELGYINVVKCVETLRKHRVNLVQTLGQYIFLHEALLEALTCTTMAVSTSEFQEIHRKLLEMDNATKKRMLDDEFEKLPMYVSDPEEDVYENAKNMENRHKNRYSNILPDKNHCPFLNVYVKGRDSYINAVFLPAYKENNIFIITQTPLENTIVDFWRMVYQFEVGSIVMLNTLSEMKEEECYWTEDKEMLEIGPFGITLESKSCDDVCTNYTMLLNYQEERRRVRLSRATYWAHGKPVPMSPTAMLKQIDLVEKWQQESGSKPIIVHCMNGAEKSGLFCVIAALLERTKIEHDVAVEQIIKQMRSRRPQIIPNVDQFKFCYDTMLAYLNQFDTYSNFTGL